MAIQLTWVAGLALLLSVLTDAPLGAVGGAVLISILSQILNQIDALGDLRNWLPTQYSFAWTGALVDPIRWDDMVRGGFLSLAYAVAVRARSPCCTSGARTSPADLPLRRPAAAAGRTNQARRSRRGSVQFLHRRGDVLARRVGFHVEAGLRDQIVPGR